MSLSFLVARCPVRVHLDCAISADILEGHVEDVRIAPEGDVILF